MVAVNVTVEAVPPVVHPVNAVFLIFVATTSVVKSVAGSTDTVVATPLSVIVTFPANVGIAVILKLATS